MFKPLPPLDGESGSEALELALESFVRQLDPRSELLLGVSRADSGYWGKVTDRWRREFPRAVIRLCVGETPRHRANPKVAWLETLAPRAEGGLWLWSDADIVAPDGLLDGLRAELERQVSLGRSRAVTTPYCIRQAGTGTGLLDTTYVNAEFLPGTLLLGRLGTVGFALGAATLFRRDDLFREAPELVWEALGRHLADDHELGRLLAPVSMSGFTVETLAQRGPLGDALRHLHRWQRTIRWCRPGAYAALLLVHPLVGWAFWLAWNPGLPSAWWNGGAQWALECLAFLVVLRTVGVNRSWSQGLVVAAWPVLRVAIWLAAWLPIPVVWSEPGKPWTEPVTDLGETPRREVTRGG